MAVKPSKLLVLGLDAALPDLLKRFIEEGVMPNLTKLVDRGAFTRVITTFPPLTAAAWAAITTGAGPGSAGIPSLMVHLPGEELDKWHTSFDHRYLKAETLWEAGTREGKKAALINWPVTWPVDPTQGTQVAASLNPPFRFFYMPLWDIAGSSLFSTERHACNQIPGRAVVVTPQPASEWVNLPESKQPPLEFALTVPPVYVAGISYYALIVDSQGSGYDQLMVYIERDGSKCVAQMDVGEFSDWITETFQTASGAKQGRFRLQLVSLNSDGTGLKLYVSAINTAETYTVPPSLTPELEAAAGPYMEVDDPWAYMDGWIPLETYMDQLEAHNKWWTRATSHTLQTREWDMAFSWVGTIDHVQHVLYGGIDPKSRHYDPVQAPIWLDAVRQVYQSVDKGIGEILANVDRDETLVMAVSDHGFTCLDLFPFLKRRLADAGLLAFELDHKTGEMLVDWSKTKCFPLEPCHAHIYVNLKGRDPHGIVSLEEYPAVQKEIIEALLAMRDPDTGDRIVAVAITKQEAQTLGVFQGDGYDRIGDVLFALHPGYMANPFIYRAAVRYKDGTERLIANPEMFERSSLTHNFTGAHLTLPTIPEMHAALVLAGPGVRHVDRRHPMNVIDIAPTVAHIMGIPCPKDAEGNIVRDIPEQL